MRRIIATGMALLLLTLCGCKNAKDYVSELTRLVKDKAESTFSVVLDKTEQIG